jgi:hypothetical protein
MITVTAVPRPALAGDDASADWPSGSPEPGLAIVPLGVVPLKRGYFLPAAREAETVRSDDGPGSTGSARWLRPRGGNQAQPPQMLPADHARRCSERDAQKRVDRVADEAAVGGLRNGQDCVRPGVDHGQRARSVEVIGQSLTDRAEHAGRRGG